MRNMSFITNRSEDTERKESKRKETSERIRHQPSLACPSISRVTVRKEERERDMQMQVPSAAQEHRDSAFASLSLVPMHQTTAVTATSRHHDARTEAEQPTATAASERRALVEAAAEAGRKNGSGKCIVSFKKDVFLSLSLSDGVCLSASGA